jgi:hypothetical protein
LSADFDFRPFALLKYAKVQFSYFIDIEWILLVELIRLVLDIQVTFFMMEACGKKLGLHKVMEVKAWLGARCVFICV